MKILYAVTLYYQLFLTFLFQDRNGTAYLLYLSGLDRLGDSMMAKENPSEQTTRKYCV